MRNVFRHGAAMDRSLAESIGVRNGDSRPQLERDATGSPGVNGSDSRVQSTISEWMQRHRVRTWYLVPLTESELRALWGDR